ncbi:MAG: hypothetical protein ACFFF4_17105 [Candidatus Thorarchaeota archaeon]
MESVTKTRGFAVETEEITEDETEFTSEVKVVSEKRISDRAWAYTKASAGIAAMVAIASIPFFTIAGMVVIVIIAEIYMADWTYSVFKSRRITVASSNADDERSKVVSTTSSKDQFIK